MSELHKRVMKIKENENKLLKTLFENDENG